MHDGMHTCAQAFSGLLNNELRAGGWQQRRAQQETFKTLLGPHYKPVAAVTPSAGASSGGASSARASTSTGASVHKHEHTDVHEREHVHEDPSDGEVSVCDEPPDEAAYDSVWDSD